MVGKIRIFRSGGYDPAQGKNVIDPTLENVVVSEEQLAQWEAALAGGEWLPRSDSKRLIDEVRRLQAEQGG